MKKFYLLGIAFFSLVAAKSQSLEDINEMISKSQYRDAKAGIEKYLLNPKKAKDAEAWFYKGVIYNALSKDPTVGQVESYALKSDAYDAFKMNQTLDPKDIQMTFQQHIPYLDLYFEFTNLGVKQFNDKNFEGAMNSFKKANEVKDYIVAKKYEYEQAKLYPLDTGLVRNIAITAMQASQATKDSAKIKMLEQEEIQYLSKLIDAKVGGDEFFDVYSTVAEYYLKKNDAAGLSAVVAKGQAIYPKSNYWLELEIRSLGEHPEKDQLFKKYEELIALHPESFYLNYSYAVELFKTVSGKDLLTEQDMAQLDKLSAVLRKSITLEGNDDVASCVLMANHLYRYAYELQNTAKAIKSVKPDDVKKKTALKDAANKNIDECLADCNKAVDFIEKAQEKTSLQKANYRILLGFMKEIYETKGDKVKMAEVEKKLAVAEKW